MSATVLPTEARGATRRRTATAWVLLLGGTGRWRRPVGRSAATAAAASKATTTPTAALGAMVLATATATTRRTRRTLTTLMATIRAATAGPQAGPALAGAGHRAQLPPPPWAASRLCPAGGGGGPPCRWWPPACQTARLKSRARTRCWVAAAAAAAALPAAAALCRLRAGAEFLLPARAWGPAGPRRAPALEAALRLLVAPRPEGQWPWRRPPPRRRC